MKRLFRSTFLFQPKPKAAAEESKPGAAAEAKPADPPAAKPEEKKEEKMEETPAAEKKASNEIYCQFRLCFYVGQISFRINRERHDSSIKSRILAA